MTQTNCELKTNLLVVPIPHISEYQPLHPYGALATR